MLKNLKSELQINQNYFFMSILISVLTIIPEFFWSPTTGHTVFLTLLLIFLILTSKFSKTFFAFLVIFINFSNVLLGHIAIHWHYTLNIEPRLELALLSPHYESMEYLQSYIDYRDISLGALTLFTLLLLYRYIKHFSHSYKLLKLISIGTSLLLFTFLSLTSFLIEEDEGRVDIPYSFTTLFTNSSAEPVSIPYEYYKAAYNNNAMSIYLERLKFLRKLTSNHQNNAVPFYDKVVVILGESANKHHMSLYGYPTVTDPFLSALNKNKQLYVFNAIAPTNQTRYSVPMVLTKANVRNYPDGFIHSTSILSDFKMKGYKTYWLSNQGRAGEHDLTVASMADEANISFFANMNWDEAKTDNIIVNKIINLSMRPKKEMFLLHLMGSHADYQNRYEIKNALYKYPESITQEYDNSIHYTDFIIKEIFEHFKGKKLLLFYISDHAEIVNEKEYGHGFFPSFKDEYDVPFVVYSSIKNKRLDLLLKESKKCHLNMENFNDIVEYVSGINQKKNLSFSSDVIAVEPKNVLNYNDLQYFK